MKPLSERWFDIQKEVGKDMYKEDNGRIIKHPDQVISALLTVYDFCTCDMAFVTDSSERLLLCHVDNLIQDISDNEIRNLILNKIMICDGYLYLQT